MLICIRTVVSILHYFYRYVANLLMLGFGAGCGWFSPALPLLLSSNTPLSSGALTTQELAWSGSILSLGGVTGSLVGGLLMIRIGTKCTLLLLTIPQMVIFCAR